MDFENYKFCKEKVQTHLWIPDSLKQGISGFYKAVCLLSRFPQNALHVVEISCKRVPQGRIRIDITENIH